MKIAIVEDDINLRKTLEIAFAERSEFEVTSFKNAKDALKKLDDSYELVITDLTMPGMDGLEFLRELNGKYEAIVITGNATLGKAIEAMRLGAKDFLQKPFEFGVLIEAINRAQKVREISKTIPKNESKPEESVAFFVASSKALEEPKKVALKVAPTDATVMLLGESGVGKEVFATYIHSKSKREHKPFVAVNMAALPDSLVESELFGFEKGAFTDAHAPKMGRFEEADGGTLFLDEIGEMPYPLQSKLLRAIQEKKIRRLGSTKDISVDIRIVCATNKNMHDSIKEGKFREDLYYRLNTIEIPIPPLRERTEEILTLANAIVLGACQKYEKPQKKFTKDAEELLLSYRWPGNIRELISVCERAVIISDSASITANDLFIKHREGGKTSNIADLEKALIVEAMKESGDDIETCAKLLALSAKDLEAKLAKHKINTGENS